MVRTVRWSLDKCPRGAGLAAALLVAASMLSPLVAPPAQAQEQSRPGGFTAEQFEGLKQIMRQYLMDNPEVLIQSLTEYQQRQRLADQQRQQDAVIAQRDALRNDPAAPVLGNPAGDVTVVEFFDYRCQYCRRVADDLRDVIESDGRVRLVMKEFPILGQASLRASQAALAAVKQGKYEAYHVALMSAPGDMSDPYLMQVALEVGLDVEQLKADMESEEIGRYIRRNHALAQELDINGTPAFVFGDTLVPGAVDADTMRQLIAQARAKAS